MSTLEDRENDSNWEVDVYKEKTKVLGKCECGEGEILDVAYRASYNKGPKMEHYSRPEVRCYNSSCPSKK